MRTKIIIGLAAAAAVAVAVTVVVRTRHRALVEEAELWSEAGAIDEVDEVAAAPSGHVPPAEVMPDDPHRLI
ncbi:hypothetical protein ACQBAU_18460 [Propionibacteriaceae bacterium Y2011]